MSIGSLIISIFCAVFGGYSGHYFTQKSYEKRVSKLEIAFYNEFRYIVSELELWLPTLVSEYRKPLVGGYSGSPELDLSLVNALVIELAGTHAICPPEQRKLIIRLKANFVGIEAKDKNRDLYIKRWLENGDLMDNNDERNVSCGITFHTAELLVEVVEVIFYLNKLIEEQSRFNLSDYHTNLDYSKVACKRSKLDFDSSFWDLIYRRLGFHSDE